MTLLLMLADGSLYLTDSGEYDRDARFAGMAGEPKSWLVPGDLLAEAWRYYGVANGWADFEFSSRDEAEAAFAATAVGYRGMKS